MVYLSAAGNLTYERIGAACTGTIGTGTLFASIGIGEGVRFEGVRLEGVRLEG